LLQPKPAVNEIAPCIHGGVDYGELKENGIALDAVLDFSVSSNPFGPPPGIREALSTVSIENYPDSEAGELKQKLSEKLNVVSGNLLVGHGSTELIRLVAIAYFDSGDKVLIPQPTYGEYEIACRLVSARVFKQPMLKEMNFRLNISETEDLIRQHRPKGIFLCNPNNPTGQYLAKEDFERILSVAEDSLVVLDEAYVAFTENAWKSLDLVDRGNLIIIRSMTKDYALAGLRLGYAIASGSIISSLRRVRPPWNVNIAAQNAGVVALNNDDYLGESWIKIREAKDFLVKELAGLGLSPLPSQANFFLVEVGDAGKFRQALMKKGILVRDCTSFGLPHHIRLASRPIGECQKLIEAIQVVRGYAS